MNVQGPDPVDESGGYAELYGLLEQAIRHLESSDFRGASAKLESACNKAASLWDAGEAPRLAPVREHRKYDTRMPARRPENRKLLRVIRGLAKCDPSCMIEGGRGILAGEHAAGSVGSLT
jgi:hypothetical protein